MKKVRIMTVNSNDSYHCGLESLVCKDRNALYYMMHILNWRDWNTACKLYGPAAIAVNKTYGGALWHTSALSMAIANSTPGLAGNSHIVLPPQTKWAGRSNPAIMSTISTVSKPTTVTPTSLSFRHLPMPKSTTNNFQNQPAGGRNAALYFDSVFVGNTELKKLTFNKTQTPEIGILHIYKLSDWEARYEKIGNQ